MTVVFGQGPLRIEDINALAARDVAAELDGAEPYRALIEKGAGFLDRLWREEGEIYGVTTGYGDSVTVDIPKSLIEALPLNLTRFHGCGLGRHFSLEEGRAIVASRLASLSKGHSGVTWALLARLQWLLSEDVIPVIPAEGSVGASGDLTPLSYLAAVLVGERDVYYQGRIRPTEDVLAEKGVAPLTLKPKEGLAIMNGTAVMTALACQAFTQAKYLSAMATRITALMSKALGGNSYHFDQTLFAVKPHPGQSEVARRLRADLHYHGEACHSRLQDRYSLRCAPHVIGALEDALPWLRGLIETELNSSNDNPIIDAVGEQVLHGGHFYGGHIAMAMDTLKVQVANLADLLDRQLASLVDSRYNNGLPTNLTGAQGPERAISHGFKAVQIGVSAWTAEALKHCMPASVFSRSTECHNQDKVSMGTIAARDCLRIIELTEQVTAAALLAASQGCWLRQRDHGLELGDELAEFCASVQRLCPPVIADRPLEGELRQLMAELRARTWSLYDNP
ncbi:MAG: aromatic amino acid ammonia-lyase [Pseudomonadota bacterium]|uniref:HAL/PAL/TAL family ammonia-lyase n=1 Tax=Gallaecimonas pentaromativorans TaxID=584787 RepID=UPI00067ED7D6|nr:aromatic amino acid ammonia-lyase [Gallaecimonas pentaromativorans]MED5525559.1 aromatic amino acid ammonia-lyase [Pseudomonadota bacterium]